MASGFSFQEQDAEKIYQIFSSHLEQLSQAARWLSDQLTDQCQAAQYQVLHNLTGGLLQAYREGVREGLCRLSTQDLCESIMANIRGLGAGEEFEGGVRALLDRMSELFAQLPTLPELPPLAGGAANMDQERSDQVQAFINRFHDRQEEVVSDYKAAIARAGEENSLVEGILGPLAAAVTQVLSDYSQACQKAATEFGFTYGQQLDRFKNRVQDGVPSAPQSKDQGRAEEGKRAMPSFDVTPAGGLSALGVAGVAAAAAGSGKTGARAKKEKPGDGRVSGAEEAKDTASAQEVQSDNTAQASGQDVSTGSAVQPYAQPDEQAGGQADTKKRSTSTKYNKELLRYAEKMLKSPQDYGVFRDMTKFIGRTLDSSPTFPEDLSLFLMGIYEEYFSTLGACLQGRSVSWDSDADTVCRHIAVEENGDYFASPDQKAQFEAGYRSNFQSYALVAEQTANMLQSGANPDAVYRNFYVLEFLISDNGLYPIASSNFVNLYSGESVNWATRIFGFLGEEIPEAAKEETERLQSQEPETCKQLTEISDQIHTLCDDHMEEIQAIAQTMPQTGTQSLPRTPSGGKNSSAGQRRGGGQTGNAASQSQVDQIINARLRDFCEGGYRILKEEIKGREEAVNKWASGYQRFSAAVALFSSALTIVGLCTGNFVALGAGAAQTFLQSASDISTKGVRSGVTIADSLTKFTFFKQSLGASLTNIFMKSANKGSFYSQIADETVLLLRCGKKVNPSSFPPLLDWMEKNKTAPDLMYVEAAFTSAYIFEDINYRIYISNQAAAEQQYAKTVWASIHMELFRRNLGFLGISEFRSKEVMEEIGEGMKRFYQIPRINRHIKLDKRVYRI